MVTSRHGERMLRLKRRTGVLRLRGLTAALILATTLVLLLVAAVLADGWAFVGCALVSYLADLYLHRTEPRLMRRLGQLRAGVTLRTLLRFALLLLLFKDLGIATPEQQGAVAVLAPLLLAMHALFTAACATIRRHRGIPVVTRNIGFGRMRFSGAAPRLLCGWPGQRLLHQELVVYAGLALSVARQDAQWTLWGLVVSCGLSALTLLLLLPYLVLAFRFPRRTRILRSIGVWITGYRPEAILYFSGSRDSAYQVNMWLETMEKLDARVLVVLRERAVLQRLQPTTLPVLCVPAAVHLMDLDLSSVRVALYAANVGKNIHMLRVPTMKHVFIGHGDSDKLASVNPFSKVYDEVWVAGAAGRDRYMRASVGVEDTDIVEVGRPQLDRVRPAVAPQAPAPVPTVLYAPTWEGWTDDPGNTSLTVAGEKIVKTLLTSTRPVRLVYKPHPFTGTRSPEALRAHLSIIRMIEKANEKRLASGRFELPDKARRRRLTERLAGIERELEYLRRELCPEKGDDAERSKNAAAASPGLIARLKELEERWHGVYWQMHPSWEHHVVQGTLPSLFQCFEQADLLVSDISSVVSDFIASLKPYAVTDGAGLGEEEFRHRNTAARAAYVLPPDVENLRSVLATLFDPRRDLLRADRERLRHYLLGGSEPSSTERFSAAVNDLARRGGQERDRLELAEAAALPEPVR